MVSNVEMPGTQEVDGVPVAGGFAVAAIALTSLALGPAGDARDQPVWRRLALPVEKRNAYLAAQEEITARRYPADPRATVAQFVDHIDYLVKKIGIAFAALIVVFIVVVAMQPSTFRVERSLVIAFSPCASNVRPMMFSIELDPAVTSSSSGFTRRAAPTGLRPEPPQEW